MVSIPVRLRDAPFGDRVRLVRPRAAAIAFPADNVEDFPFLYAYSPLHHIAQGTGAKVVSAIAVSWSLRQVSFKATSDPSLA